MDKHRNVLCRFQDIFTPLESLLWALAMSENSNSWFDWLLFWMVPWGGDALETSWHSLHPLERPMKCSLVRGNIKAASQYFILHFDLQGCAFWSNFVELTSSIFFPFKMTEPPLSFISPPWYFVYEQKSRLRRSPSNYLQVNCCNFTNIQGGWKIIRAN